MLIADTPPAAIAPATPCADEKPVNLHISWTTTAISPDCRWAVVSISDDDIAVGKRDATPFNLPELTDKSPYRAFVIERATGRIVYHFEMERSASLHWLKDCHYLVVNYFEGSGSDIPLVFTLKPGPTRLPANLADLVLPSVLKRAGIPDRRPFGLNRWMYHYYVDFIADTGDRLLVSAQLWWTKNGAEGSGIVKCYIYSVSKATLRYRFVREDDIDNCPRNPDEKWN